MERKARKGSRVPMSRFEGLVVVGLVEVGANADAFAVDAVVADVAIVAVMSVCAGGPEATVVAAGGAGAVEDD